MYLDLSERALPGATTKSKEKTICITAEKKVTYEERSSLNSTWTVSFRSQRIISKRWRIDRV
jgi:hypothetical protein